MAEEQIINIVKNGDFNNITLKDLEPENYIFVTKLFDEGREVQSKFNNADGTPRFNYSIKVEYNGEENVSFFLKDYEHEAFKNTGAVGDVIKITCKLLENKRMSTFYKSFEFEKVEE